MSPAKNRVPPEVSAIYREMGLRSAQARAKLTPQERSRIARKALQTRLARRRAGADKRRLVMRYRRPVPNKAPRRKPPTVRPNTRDLARHHHRPLNGWKKR